MTQRVEDLPGFETILDLAELPEAEVWTSTDERLVLMMPPQLYAACGAVLAASSYKLEQSKHKNQGLAEDAIAISICSKLKMAGCPAAHDKDVGGYCDISIEGRDLFLWLAAVKGHGSHPWLDKGFKQLSTRYSTGVVGQDHGDVLVYCYVADAKKVLERWRTELKARNSEVKTEDSPCGNPLIFCSTHKHAMDSIVAIRAGTAPPQLL
jgi:hypothetical protein